MRIDNDGLARYARTVERLKGLALDPSAAEDHVESLRVAFGTVYRAVAFDIDGTLTIPGEVELDQELIEVISDDLLRRGVPVILITGRGRSAREALVEQFKDADLAERYLRRLFLLIRNGT